MSEQGQEWYVLINNKKIGPKTAAEMKSFYAQHIIDDDTLVWAPTLMGDWVPLSKSNLIPPPPPGSSSQKPQQTPTPKLDKAINFVDKTQFVLSNLAKMCFGIALLTVFGLIAYIIFIPSSSTNTATKESLSLDSIFFGQWELIPGVVLRATNIDKPLSVFSISLDPHHLTCKNNGPLITASFDYPQNVIKFFPQYISVTLGKNTYQMKKEGKPSVYDFDNSIRGNYYLCLKNEQINSFSEELNPSSSFYIHAPMGETETIYNTNTEGMLTKLIETTKQRLDEEATKVAESRKNQKENLSDSFIISDKALIKAIYPYNQKSAIFHNWQANMSDAMVSVVYFQYGKFTPNVSITPNMPRWDNVPPNSMTIKIDIETSKNSTPDTISFIISDYTISLNVDPSYKDHVDDLDKRYVSYQQYIQGDEIKRFIHYFTAFPDATIFVDNNTKFVIPLKGTSAAITTISEYAKSFYISLPYPFVLPNDEFSKLPVPDGMERFSAEFRTLANRIYLCKNETKQEIKEEACRQIPQLTERLNMANWCYVGSDQNQVQADMNWERCGRR